MGLNLFERMFPGVAINLQVKRMQLTRLYDAAKTSNYHKRPDASRSGDGVMDHAGSTLRTMARSLDENHDLAVGILDTMVNRVVGEHGITVEPMAQTTGGKAAKKVNKELRKLWKEFNRRPEVTGELPGAEMQRQLCRSWLRDGEVLGQHVLGTGPSITHGSRVPYSVELIEADHLPFDLMDAKNGVVHGVEKNVWGKPVAFFFYLEHPGNTTTAYTRNSLKTKRVPADKIFHLKFTRRIKQTRGVSVFHSILNRLDDLKDYEESERIAARVAAALTAFIRKGTEYTGATNAAAGERTLEMAPGLIVDDLLPGEEIGTISSDRPNSGLEAFRNGQLKAMAAGVGASYSSIAKDYSGNYSSQRQELVESAVTYGRLRSYFIGVGIMPIYENFVTMAITAGLVKLPKTIDMATIANAEYRGPGQPWIDPKKEIEADVLAIENKLKSRAQTIRDRGGDPEIVAEQLKLELDEDEKNKPKPAKPMPSSEEDDAAEALEKVANA